LAHRRDPARRKGSGRAVGRESVAHPAASQAPRSLRSTPRRGAYAFPRGAWEREKTRYGVIDMPVMEYDLTHRYDSIDISDAEFGRLIAAATWKTKPEFLRRGRVARHLLREPASLKSHPNRQLTVAKLKGVEVYDPALLGKYHDRILDEFSDEAMPPTDKPLNSFVTYPHVGIDNQGRANASTVANIGSFGEGTLSTCLIRSRTAGVTGHCRPRQPLGACS